MWSRATVKACGLRGEEPTCPLEKSISFFELAAETTTSEGADIF